MSDHLRVHIVPIGYDSTRVTEPLIQKKVDRVHFIRYTGDKKDSTYYDFIEKELKKKNNKIEIKPYFLDIWNLYECIAQFREIILAEKKQGNHVFVNVATGSKITAIAGMLACMAWNATPYYVHILYEPQTGKSVIKSKIKKEFDDLPVYAINQPKKLHLRILDMLEKNNQSIRKSDLIEELERLGFIKQKERPRKQAKFTTHAKYSQLHAILAPMETEWKFIKTESHGKRSEISITEQGRRALKIFGIESEQTT